MLSLTDRAEAGVGRLAGVPLAIKDKFDTVDLPTTGSTPVLPNSRPACDQ